MSGVNISKKSASSIIGMFKLQYHKKEGLNLCQSTKCKTTKLKALNFANDKLSLYSCGKFLDLTEFKAFTDDNQNVARKMICVFDGVEIKHCRKEENAG